MADGFNDAVRQFDRQQRLEDLLAYATKLRKLYPGHDDISLIADTIDQLARGPRPMVESAPKDS